MSDCVPFSTERLVLRRVEHTDFAALYEIYGNEQNSRFQFGPSWSPEQVEEFIVSQSNIYLGDPGVPFVLAATEKLSESLAGAVELTISSVEDRQAEIGFTFNPSFCGRGLATEAVNAAVGFAFKHMDLHRVYAGVDTRNEASWKLMERIGMRREAHFIHANREGDDWIDDFVYAMLDCEWNGKNTELRR